MPTTQRLLPTQLLSTSGFASCTLSMIDDDTAAPDAEWCVASANNVNTVVRVGVPNPGFMAGTQTIAWQVRRNSASGASGTPTTQVRVWQNGSIYATSSTTAITSGTGQVVSFNFEASVIPDKVADLEFEIINTATGGGASSRGSIDVGALTWVASLDPKPVAYDVTFPESFGVAEQRSLAAAIALVESFATTSESARLHDHYIMPGVTVFQSPLGGGVGFTLEVGELYAFVESRSGGSGLGIARFLAFSESRRADASVPIQESLGVSELSSIEPQIDFASAFAFAESQAKQPRPRFLETLDVAELRLTGIELPFAESLLMEELSSIEPQIDFASAFAFAESQTKQPRPRFSTNIAFFEERQAAIEKMVDEALPFIEVFGRNAGFTKSFAESVAFVETAARGQARVFAETLKLVEALRRPADMVVSDFMFSTGDMTEKEFRDFMSFGNVPGYSKWRDFIPGDYEYREALIRIIMESKNSDRGLISNLQATVDVPDMVERGTATITVASVGATVTFNKNFHATPEITMVTRSSSGGNPVIPEFFNSPSTTSFQARLRDTVTGQYVTGSFTWAAHGY